jgi:hypothetical protein
MKLLWHLINIGITEHTNEVQTSTVRLADALNCSRDKVREAAQSIGKYMEVTAFNGVGYRFRMPPEWFEESTWFSDRLLPVENIAELPGDKPDPPPGLPGHQAAKPGSSCRVTRQLGANKRRIPGSSERMEGEYQAACWRETRQPVTQNQQLTETGNVSIDRSELSKIEVLKPSIDSIACAKVLNPDQLDAAKELSDYLHFYMRELGNPVTGQMPPDEQILARCLTIAPLGSIFRILRPLQVDGVRAGNSYAWFVTVIFRAEYKLSGKVLHDAYRRVAIQERRRPQKNLDFSTRMTDEIRQKARRIS